MVGVGASAVDQRGRGSTVAAGFTDTADDVQRVLVETGETLESGGCQPWIYYGP